MHQQITGSFGLFILALSAVAQTAPPSGMPRAWRLIHPDAAVLLGVDVRAIRESAAGKSLTKNMDQASMGMMALPALQFLSDIDQVLLSAPGGKNLWPKASAAGKPGAAPTSQVLIVLTGHFPAAHLQSLMKGVHRSYNGVQIYSSSPGGANSDVALLDESTLLFGDADSLRGAIDRSKRSNAPPSAVPGRAAALAQSNDLWLLATAPAAMLPPAGMQPGGVKISALASQIRGIEAGIAFREGLRVAVTLSTKDAESASRMVRAFSDKLKSSMAGTAGATQAAEFLRKMDIAAEGSKIRVKFAMSKEEMDRAVALAQAMNAQRMNAAGQPGFTINAQPQHPDPGTIKVYGMPGGVQEIPVAPEKKE